MLACKRLNGPYSDNSNTISEIRRSSFNLYTIEQFLYYNNALTCGDTGTRYQVDNLAQLTLQTIIQQLYGYL